MTTLTEMLEDARTTFEAVEKLSREMVKLSTDFGNRLEQSGLSDNDTVAVAAFYLTKCNQLEKELK